ncbi:MAG: hypothetical protein EOO46_14820 [Flavobacterium sp.]|nr:MAG: hypothetical protein EOO46_14820 [Flavobacterium sp.]
MFETPVLLIVFNRPSSTRRVFEAIREVKPSKLYIAADGCREGNKEDEAKCFITRKITENVDWPCETKRLYHDLNLGCSLGPRAAFDWFFENEKEGIILEDDCLPHPDFFCFASSMLEKYRENKKIISINGSNLGYSLSNGESYTFSRYMNMWGWATWADRAKAIDYQLKGWKNVKKPGWFVYKHMRQNLFDTDLNWYKYWQRIFDLTAKGENVTWWDWQWIYHQMTNKQLSIVPAVNLVSNIGFSGDATHTLNANNPAACLPLNSISFPIVHPDKIKPDPIYEVQYVKYVWCYHKRSNLFHLFARKLKS